MKKIYFLLFVLMISASCKKNGNQTSSGLQKISDKEYKIGSDIRANDMTLMSDGSLIILADSGKDYYGRGIKLALVRVTPDGNVSWTKTFVSKANPSFTVFYAFSVQKDQNENLVVTAQIEDNSGGGAAWIFKTTKDGVLLWERVIPNITHEGIYGPGNCVIKPDGSIVTLFNPSEGSQGGCYLGFISADGSTFSLTSISNIVYAGELKLTSDNNLVLVGANFDASRNTKLALVKLNLSGQILWRTDLTTQPGSQLAYSLIESNGNFYVTGHYTEGTSYRNFLFASFDSNGKFINMQNFGRNYDDTGYVIEKLPTNDLIIGGYSQSAKSTNLYGELYINILDKDGNVKTQDDLGNSGRILVIKNSINNIFYVLGDEGDNLPGTFRLIKYTYQ